ncbi:phenylacetate--CoA ligase family protein [Aureivirga marina]|uniref:phenylacetate--CoA ligase family protein n=1 Tax=Aureivirga marina TaxID=1182451 RepID=UPI0018C938AC|nr:phenylacetate--CoA ligase family protein [Aureivirga marina]
MKELIYRNLPNFFQNTLIGFFNLLSYKKRYGGKYKDYLNKFKENQELPIDKLLKIQEDRLIEFLNYAKNNSKFYNEIYKDISLPKTVSEIGKLPILNKETLRQNIEDIHTIEKNEGIVSKTGGTTGKSLEVLFTHDNTQERFAMLDNFRFQSGYKLGEKTAWFSGKAILTNKDVIKKRFWKTDYFHNVRYYSTFHIKDDYLKYYVNNIIEFQPKFIVGFPSTILELAKYGIRKNIDFPKGIIKAIFPTAESITDEMRKIIESFFKAKIYNQYASSEGAPFIFECDKGNLHLDLQSGVFEILDDNDNYADEGRLVLTSFTTKGTPLIRYDIGDSLILKKGTCNCGNNNPLVKEILGRVDDFIFSPENGKINLGNISNTLKDIKGIIKFQAVQDQLDSLKIYIMRDSDIYNENYEEKFRKNWTDRVGNKMLIEFIYVDNLESENSGKFRMIKNNIKHLI